MACIVRADFLCLLPCAPPFDTRAQFICLFTEDNDNYHRDAKSLSRSFRLYAEFFFVPPIFAKNDRSTIATSFSAIRLKNSLDYVRSRLNV